MTNPKPLNRVEIWVVEHNVPVFLTLTALIIAGAVAVFFTFQQSGEAQKQVNIIKPQVTRINRAICDRQSLRHPQRAERCAERIRVGLINCRRVQSCRAAYLALATFPPPVRPEGGGVQTPSTAGQQPSPGHQPGHQGGHGGGHSHHHKTPHPTPQPSPAPVTPTPTAPSPAEPSPGNSGNGNGGDSGTKACVHIVVSACVKTELGLEGGVP